MDPANLLPANQITSRKRRRDELVGHHYDVLGIARTASNLEIRSAYRKGALQTHPDKGGDPEEFKKVVAAFEVLSDPKKRGDYDQVLQQTGSRDGLSANHRYTAEEHAGPSRSKILQGDARVMELDLICTALSEGLNNWASSLEAAGSDILQVLAAQLATKGGKKLPDAGHEDVDGPPRKVEAPEGLPPGWSCFEHTYKSGARKGKKYYRFTSPWGAKRVASVKAALRADAEHHGRDGAEAARLWEAPKKPKATASRGERFRTEQRSIYAVRANNGVVRYFVQLSYSSFTIRTGRTLVLAKAIDWHIALTQTVAAASARLREGGSAPLTVAELRQLLQSEPEISLSFRSAFSSKLGNIYSPTSRILEMAVSMQHRFRTFVKRSNLTKENLKAFQVMSLKEVSMQKRSRCGLQRQLLRAIHTELRSRGFDLMEIKAMNLPMDSNGSENPMPMHLEVADDEKRTGRTSADEVKSEDVAAAQDLKAALGLSAPSARRLAAFLRTLSTTELRRRVKILQTPSKVELERQAVERTRRSSQSRLALPNPHHQHDKVPALPAPEGELFGLPTDSARAPLKYLNFIDRSKLRAICRAARNLLDFDLANVVVHFTYETEFFDSIPRCTRSGRVMNNGQAVHGRRLLGFLTRHAGLFQQLDLRRAPIDALESNVLRTAFACMNHLTEIHLPTDGWSSHADRQRLLWALPRRVTVQWSKSRELRSPKVQSKFQSKLNQNEKNENNEQTVAVVLPVQPDDSNDPGHAQVLGLSQLIVGWRRIPYKKKKLLYGLLREAAMAGRIESRKSRWEWKLDDPQLQVVKDLLTSVGVSLIRSISL